MACAVVPHACTAAATLPASPQLPLLGPDPSASKVPLADPEQAAQLDCRIFLSALLIVLGVVAPTLLVAKLNEPMVAAAAAAEEAAALDFWRHGRSRQRAQPAAERGGSGLASRCLAWLRRASADAEAALQHLASMLMNGAGSPLLTLVAWWLVASLVWLAALVLEQPQLALSPVAGP